MSNLSDKATEATARFLRRQGFDILETGWTSPEGTADVVAEDGHTLVFVDVEARLDREMGFPPPRIDEAYRVERELVALAYIADHAVAEKSIRFDLVTLVLAGGDRAIIRHMTNCLGQSVAPTAPFTLPEAA